MNLNKTSTLFFFSNINMDEVVSQQETSVLRAETPMETCFEELETSTQGSMPPIISTQQLKDNVNNATKELDRHIAKRDIMHPLNMKIRKKFMQADNMKDLRYTDKNQELLYLMEREGYVSEARAKMVATEFGFQEKIKEPLKKSSALYLVFCVLRKNIQKYHLNFRLNLQSIYDLLDDDTVHVYVGECHNDLNVLVEHA